MTRCHPLGTLKALLAIVAVVLCGTVAQAQEPPQAGDDPPVRVGRMSYVSGDVSFSPAGNEEWVHARVNRPIVTGDQLWSDNNGRAEITIDNGTLWLGEYTSVAVSNLDDRVAQFQLQQGTLDFRVRRLPSGNIVEVDTPNLAFTVTRPGRYRVVVDPQGGSTTVIVRAGAGDVYGESASYAIASGQAYRFYGTDLRDSEYFDVAPPDAFERWAAERDRRYDNVASARYVSPEVIGYEDLDTYGTWSVQASYGNVWFPREVPTGWVPYRDGHWAWIDPWGWTWVDDAPWGFAPFHYGRWAWFNSGWGWIPGPRAVRPVYAPALVAFIGGAGFSISVSTGPAIGWFPLGPREIYRPPYYVSRDYFRQVNVSNTVINNVNITNVYNNYRSNTNVTQTNYVNLRAPNAVTAVPPTVFAQSQNVRRAAVAVPASTLSRVQVQPVARVAPTRAAFLGAAPVAQAKPPATVISRPVVARHAPAPAPVRDTARLQALEQNPGRPLTNRQLQQLRASQPTAAAPARPVRVVEQPKPAANATPPARSASERAAQRAPGAPGAATAPGGPAGAAPGRAAAAPAGAPSAGAPSAQPGSRAPAGGERPPQAGEPRARPPSSQVQRPDSGSPAAGGAPGERPTPQARPAPQERPQPQAGRTPQERTQPLARPGQPEQSPSEARPEPQERPQPQARPQPQERSIPQERPQPQARPVPQERPQPQARPVPQERPQPQARPQPQERAQPQARPEPQERPQPQARPVPQERPQPQARPQPQERPEPQARPVPQERPQPQARPQPQERPQPQARPQPQERPQPQARPQPQERPQPQQRNRGNDKDKDKDKDNN